MYRALLALTPVVLLWACDGPNQKAGREKDQALATASGIDFHGDGPNERIGEAQDHASDAAQDARKAQANALRKQAREIRSTADVEAARLEQQARATRERAKADAAPLETQADNLH